MKHEIFSKAGQFITSKTGRTALKLKKASPDIMIVLGVGGIIAGTILACKATRKLDETLDEVKKDIDQVIRENSVETESGKLIPKEGEQSYRKAVAKAKIKGGMKIVKLYAPSIGVCALSIASICESHYILKKRNIQMAAAYVAVEEGFDKYRNRVISEFGEDVDRRMRFGAKDEEIEVAETDEKGKEKKQKIKIENIDPSDIGVSEFAKFFDEGSIHWTKDPETNLFRLNQIQRYCNEKLKARGHLFLNEVYDELDIPRTSAGCIIGWVIDGEKSHGEVSFNIYNKDRDANRRFVNGDENVILLDFNVDGYIYNLI